MVEMKRREVWWARMWRRLWTVLFKEGREAGGQGRWSRAHR